MTCEELKKKLNEILTAMKKNFILSFSHNDFSTKMQCCNDNFIFPYI